MRAALRAAEGGHIRACSSACGDHMVPGLGYDRWRPCAGAVRLGALEFVLITLGVLLAPLLCAVGTQDGHCTRWGRVTCARHCSETPTHAICVPVCSRHEPKGSNTTHFETFCLLGHPPAGAGGRRRFSSSCRLDTRRSHAWFEYASAPFRPRLTRWHHPFLQ